MFSWTRVRIENQASVSDITASIVNPKQRVGPHKFQHKNNGKKSALNSRVFFHTDSEKKKLEKADKVPKKNPRISCQNKKQSKVSEIAVSTLIQYEKSTHIIFQTSKWQSFFKFERNRAWNSLRKTRKKNE